MYAEVAMQRIRVEKLPAKKVRPRPQVLPLDPRDPDILHAKAIQERYLPPRRRAAYYASIAGSTSRSRPR